MTIPTRSAPPARRLLAFAIALRIVVGSAWAQSDEPAVAAPPPPTVAALEQALAEFSRRAGVAGAGLAVGQGQRLLHSSCTGDFAADRQFPIASSSKWLAVATVLALCDDGVLDLDAPVARYLPEFAGADRRLLTLRQCLSCTSGLPPRPPVVRSRANDMDAMARALADQPLQSDAGLEFAYGGSGFEVAACAAVRKTGKDWHALFAARIAEPLGLSQTAFGRLVPIGAEPGTAKVPWVAGGAVSTLRDLERFVRMLAQRGEFDGRRVLQQESVDAMFRSQTEGMTVRIDGLDGDLAYGLGTWLQRLDGGLLRGSDPGALGCVPWIDRDLGVYGVLAVQDRLARVLPRTAAVQQAARDHVTSPAVAGRDESVAMTFGGRDRRYLLHVPPGAERALALPLLVVLHGGGGNGEQVARSTGFSALADREHFAVVYPDGTGLLRNKLLTWNSGGIDVYAAVHDIDDSGFVKAVVADVQTRVPVDPSRIYATGMSNGGMMCHRLAREAADLFAAIAPVAGAMDFTAVDDQTPIDVLIVHGTADEMVRYGGGRPARDLGRSSDRVDASVADAVKYYRARDGLAGEPQVETQGKLRIETWSRHGDDGDHRVRVVTIDGGGHEWPTVGDWNATAAVWAFCKDARRRSGN